MELIGIIYCYTSPNNKKYIGQTRNEIKRKSRWLNMRYKYAGGGKIEHSRKKYGPENFTYEVLERICANSEQELNTKLNLAETYWIKYFDTYKSGLNSSLGGTSTWTENYKKAHLSHKHSDEVKKRISEKNKLYWKSKDRHVNTDHLKKVYEENSQSIDQYTLDKKFIKTWNSAAEASRNTGIDKSSIRKCCNGKRNYINGFIWINSNDQLRLSSINLSDRELKIAQKSNRKIVQKDKSGFVINTFNTCNDAANQFCNYKDGANAISKCCRGKRKDFANYYWEYSYGT